MSEFIKLQHAYHDGEFRYVRKSAIVTLWRDADGVTLVGLAGIESDLFVKETPEEIMGRIAE